MAIYYINVQIVGRSAGRSATGAAAYRAGERIHDERTGQTYDYTRRRDEIETEILAPAGAPEWAQDRQQLWNQVEKAEKRADAQVAREIVVAFPKELDREQSRELIRAYVQEQFVARGMAADVAMHWKPDNPHAHILLPMRGMTPDGLAPKKNREWNKPEMLEQWREQWAVQSNRALERAGRAERIDHRSLAEQGLDRLPQVHLGPHAAALERRGIATEKGDHNRVVVEHNAVVVDLEKAREEREALRAERAAHERSQQRIQAGWSPNQAQALAHLETAGGGQEITERELRERYASTNRELEQANGEINAIHQQGQHLDRAGEALKAHEAAVADLRKHQTPMAKVKRIFSPDARQAFRTAQETVRDASASVHRWGVKSEPEFLQRRTEWEQRKSTQLPGLQTKADSLSSTLRVMEKALDGFDKAAERRRMAAERERVAREESVLRRLQREIERDRGRGSDRGR